MTTPLRPLLSVIFSALLLNPAQAAEPGTGETLEDFLTAALDYSPELNISRERWNVYSARKDQVTGQLLPQISANANVSDNTHRAPSLFGPSETDYRGERYSVQLSQVLFNWQAFASRGQASLQEEQSEAEYYGQVAQLLTDVAERYLGVLQAEDKLRSVESELEAMSSQVARIQRLFDLQLARITDLYDGLARLAASQAERVTADSELALYRESLRALTGLEASALSRLPEEITVQSLEGDVEIWLERARNNNRLIEARALALQSAEKQVSQARGGYLPRVSLIVQHQRSNIGFDNAPQAQTDTNYIGIDFTVPLYAGGAVRAGVRQAQSQRNIAESELRQAQLEIIQQTRTAYLQVKAGGARIAAGQALAESTDTAYTAMRQGFELGTVTSVDVLNALRDRFRAERDLQAARYEQIRASLALRREAGVLTAEDIRAVSNRLNSR